MSTGFITLPNGNIVPSVATATDLPAGATDGEVLFVEDSTSFYRYRTDSATWEQVQTSGTPASHNALTSIQGGSVSERFHLTQAQHTRLIKDISRTVVVDSLGGGDFTKIQDAIDSITDAAANKIYGLDIVQAQYVEDITLKPFIALIGRGNGPAAPLVVGKITATGFGANEFALINRMGQAYTVTSDGEVCNNWASPVFVNDFFASFATDQNYAFTGIKQDCSGFSLGSVVMVNCQITAVSEYDGSTKDIIAVEQTGNGFGAGLSNFTVQVQSKNSSGELACRRISVSGAAEYNSSGILMKISNVKAASTATACATKVTTASTGFRIASGDQIRIEGNLASASAKCMNTGGNAGEFFTVGASVYIDPAITGYAANTAVGDTQYVWLNSTNRDLTLTGSGLAIVTPYALVQTGFVAWGGSGNYWSYDNSTKVFTVLRRGTGLVKSSPVTWVADQTTTLSTDKTVHFVYIDSSGVLRSQTSWSKEDVYTKIPLFEVWVQGTNFAVVKENHPAEFASSVSAAWHNLIRSKLQDASQTLAIGSGANRQVSLVGTNTYTDHGLDTAIAAQTPTWIQVYWGASGKMIQRAAASQSLESYRSNNTDTPAAVPSGKFLVVRLGVTKESLNSSTPTFIAVSDDEFFDNLAQANNHIALGLPLAFPPEAITLEVVQLGFAVLEGNNAGAGTLASVTTALEVLGSSFVAGGTSTSASLITTNPANFDGILGSGNTSAQSCFETIDDFGKAGGFKIPSATTTQRDALTPAVGMMLVNTTTNKVQCYVNGTWVDLN